VGSWEQWRRNLHDDDPTIKPEYVNRRGDWHPDFQRDRPSIGENGETHYPSTGCENNPLVGALGGFNKADLLRRGWTRTAITRVLGRPNRIIPVWRNKARPECVYCQQRVFDAEAAGAIRYRATPKETAARLERIGEDVDWDLEPVPGELSCLQCGQFFTFEPKNTGRKRKYCSTACRNRASRNKFKNNSVRAMQNEACNHPV